MAVLRGSEHARSWSWKLTVREIYCFFPFPDSLSNLHQEINPFQLGKPIKTRTGRVSPSYVHPVMTTTTTLASSAGDVPPPRSASTIVAARANHVLKIDGYSSALETNYKLRSFPFSAGGHTWHINYCCTQGRNCPLGGIGRPAQLQPASPHTPLAISI